MKLKKTSLLTLVALFGVSVYFISCRKAIKNRKDLIGYVNDPENGLQKTQQIGDVKAVLTYKPPQLMEQNGSKKQAGFNKLYYKDKLFFVLSLSANNKELLKQLPFTQYSEMVQVLSFRMRVLITIAADNGKAIEPLDCLFQQTYGMGSANNLLIVFNQDKLLKANYLKIQVKEFGLNTGNLNFEIETEKIRDIQQIAIN